MGELSEAQEAVLRELATRGRPVRVGIETGRERVHHSAIDQLARRGLVTVDYGASGFRAGRASLTDAGRARAAELDRG
jgi:hypothetical protein